MDKLKILLSIILQIAIIFSDPTPPVWPPQWYQEYKEILKTEDGELIHTTGYQMYDWINKKQTVHIDDCRGNDVTKMALDENTPCSQIISEGKRYVYAEEKDWCCFCCDGPHGCGILKPEWISKSYEVWEGYKLIDGVFYTVFKNLDGGLDPIYTLYNVETNILSYIYRVGDLTLQIFDQNSYVTDIPYPQDLELPSTCKKSDVPQCDGLCKKFMSHPPMFE